KQLQAKPTYPKQQPVREHRIFLQQCLPMAAQSAPCPEHSCVCIPLLIRKHIRLPPLKVEAVARFLINIYTNAKIPVSIVEQVAKRGHLQVGTPVLNLL
ncbi:21770_t:CDS:2, partial [Gigaspora rosea]